MNPILWQPGEKAILGSNLAQFVQALPRPFDCASDAGYAELHRWSVAHRDEFWKALYEYSGVIGDPGATVCREGKHFTDVAWFPDGTLNFAENLLRPAELSDAPAIVFRNERGDRREITRRELHRQAMTFAGWLQGQGVTAGDRVAAVLPNVPEAVVAMLGTAAIGAIWSSCSPDFGDDAICDRFGQIEPKVLVTCVASSYFGKEIGVLAKVRGILTRLPSVKAVVVSGAGNEFTAFDTVLKSEPLAGPLERFPFAHPLAILYSSGTTGAPKCIVHGAGGTLLQHIKEHQLHSELRPGDQLFYFTTTGWMMWNWLVSGLASKAAIVLYDGSPLHPGSDALWKMAAEEGVTHFGASAKYYAAIEKAGVRPRSLDLTPLRVVLSTGSPLLPESFDFIYREVKGDVCLASISGGTDIISCFALGCPTRPVRRGELQVKGLGMDVKVFDGEGQPVIDAAGELVCTVPFPSMPVSFWNDPGKVKYRAAYFEQFDNTWCHGDWAEETLSGGIIIQGRSDATLNPGGVRIGTAEIYQQVEAFPEVAEALATAFRQEGDEKIVLFLRMKPGQTLSQELIQSIRQRLRTRCSPRHVPSVTLAAPDFPRTISGKLSEIAVRNAIHGQPVRNAAALANPESLLYFQSLEELAKQQ